MKNWLSAKTLVQGYYLDRRQFRRVPSESEVQCACERFSCCARYQLNDLLDTRLDNEQQTVTVGRWHGHCSDSMEGKQTLAGQTLAEYRQTADRVHACFGVDFSVSTETGRLSKNNTNMTNDHLEAQVAAAVAAAASLADNSSC